MLKFGSAYNGALSAHSPKAKKKKRVSRKITQKGRRFSLSPAPATIKALLEEKRPFSRKFRNSLSLFPVTIFSMRWEVENWGREMAAMIIRLEEEEEDWQENWRHPRK